MRSCEVSEVHCLVKAVFIGRGKPLVFRECGLDPLLAKCALAASPDDRTLCHALQMIGLSLSSLTAKREWSQAWAYIPTRTPSLLLPFLTPALSVVFPCEFLLQVVGAHCSHRVPVGASYETCENSCYSPIWQVGARLGDRHIRIMAKPLYSMSKGLCDYCGAWQRNYAS